MMYITGKIETIEECGFDGNTRKGVVGYRYVCTVRTPGMIVMKSSVRSRGEALTEALKYLGMPMYSTEQEIKRLIGLGVRLTRDVVDDLESYG